MHNNEMDAVLNAMDALQELQTMSSECLQQAAELMHDIRQFDPVLADRIRRGWYAQLEMCITNDHEWVSDRSSMDDSLLYLQQLHEELADKIANTITTECAS